MIVVRFMVQCRPDKTEQVKAEFEQVIAPSRAVEGVIGFDIARDLADPDSFIATELFEDRAALERQESLPEVAKTLLYSRSPLPPNPRQRYSTSPLRSHTEAEDPPAARRRRPRVRR